MRRLILTTASILALGIGGAGLAQAQGNSTQGGTSAKTPSAETSMPQAQTSMPSSEMKGSQAQTHRMATRSTRASTSEVKQVQQRLREEGLYRGRIDGKLGPRTKTALRSFQKKNGLPASASLDQRTMEALQGGGAGQGAGQGAGMTQEGSSQTNPSATQMMPQGGQQGQAGNAGAGAGNGAATTGSSTTQPGQKKY